MILALTLAATALSAESSPTAPPFFTAQEKWQCSFKWQDEKESVTLYFGVFRSHVEDDFVTDYSIDQNDDDALVFSFSDIGNTDVTGKTRKWVGVSMIDKRTGVFKRTNLDFNEPPKSADGRCNRY